MYTQKFQLINCLLNILSEQLAIVLFQPNISRFILSPLYYSAEKTEIRFETFFILRAIICLTTYFYGGLGKQKSNNFLLLLQILLWWLAGIHLLITRRICLWNLSVLSPLIHLPRLISFPFFVNTSLGSRWTPQCMVWNCQFDSKIFKAKICFNLWIPPLVLLLHTRASSWAYLNSAV